MKNDNKILDLDLDKFGKLLKNNEVKVAVIGLGRIGLPTAVAVARSGLETIGVDINPKIIESVNNGKLRVNDEPGLEQELANVIKKKKLFATTEIKEAVSNADVIIVCLPTPLDNTTKITNYAHLLEGVKQIGKFFRKKSLVVIESTVGPGIVEDKVVPEIEKISGLKAGYDFGIASCPERANPSTILIDFDKIPRIIGGINKKSSELASRLYSHFFKIKILTVQNCKTANAIKVVENVFRDVNVAFMNEIAIFCDRIGIDVIELIEGCKTKYNFIPHYPGAGVGGPCLPVNPYQLLDSPESEGILNVVRESRKVNVSMSNYVIKLITEAVKESKKELEESSFTILGVSYKPNVGDIQLSPIEVIFKRLESLGVKLKLFDPYFINKEVFSQKTEDSLEDAVRNSDGIIIGTAHDDFRQIDFREIFRIMNKPAILLDTRDIIHPSKALDIGFIYKGIGRSSWKNPKS